MMTADERGWKLHEKEQRMAWLRLTPAQRLAWLEGAKRFAEAAARARKVAAEAHQSQTKRAVRAPGAHARRELRAGGAATTNFSAVDPTLKDWASRNRLPLSTQYRDVEIRSFELVGTDGRAQIWIEIDADITVHVWDYRKRKRVFPVEKASLADGLDEALRAAKSWCGTP